MSNFTKGKWDFLHNPVSISNLEEDWFLVGSTERAVGFIRHKEDARTIAAAPQMYELLKKCADKLTGTLSQECFDLIARVDGHD